jgi:hypothetical protein
MYPEHGASRFHRSVGNRRQHTISLFHIFIQRNIRKYNPVTPWHLVRKRTIPTERPPLVGDKKVYERPNYTDVVLSISQTFPVVNFVDLYIFHLFHYYFPLFLICGQESRINDRGGIRCADHATPSIR